MFNAEVVLVLELHFGRRCFMQCSVDDCSDFYGFLLDSQHTGVNAPCTQTWWFYSVARIGAIGR